MGSLFKNLTLFFHTLKLCGKIVPSRTEPLNFLLQILNLIAVMLLSLIMQLNLGLLLEGGLCCFFETVL
jgi:hypothetical protein